MKITDIRISIVEKNERLKAVAKVTIEDALCLTDLRVMVSVSGALFVCYPVCETSSSDFRQIYYPCTKEFRTYVETAVLLAYNEKISEGVK